MSVVAWINGTSSTTINTGCILWYRMDENTGTVLNDSSPSGFTGELVLNGGFPSWTTGNFGSALAFSRAATAYAQSSSAVLNLTTTFSVSVWCLAIATGAVQPIIDIASVLTIQANVGVQFQGLVAGGATITNSSTYLTSTWYNLILTFNNGAVNFYVNGVSAGTSSASVPSAGASIVYISTPASSPGSNAWAGSIDDLRIYNIDISQEPGIIAALQTNP